MEKTINFHVTSCVREDHLTCLTGFTRDERLFEIWIEKSDPEGPIPIGDLISHEGSWAVYDAHNLWRVDVSIGSEEDFDSDSDCRLASSNERVPDRQFPYYEHELPSIVYAQITGALVASL